MKTAYIVMAITLSVMAITLSGTAFSEPPAVRTNQGFSGQGQSISPIRHISNSPAQISKQETSVFPSGMTNVPASVTSAATGRQAETQEDRSAFEEYVEGRISPDISTSVRQFGYGLFARPSTGFAPADKVPVGPDYVIGPGDEMNISIWGRIEDRWTVTVDRDGNIILPKAGVLGVAGLTFSELKQTLHKEISKYYTGFEMNVSMGALRTIRIYVVGNARTPGSYAVSSLSTMISALFESGGPSKTGSMRNIELKRNGKVIATLDMYDFLLGGDKTGDARLMPEDVIFIPPVGPLSAVTGNVKTPAIFELKGETAIRGILRMAGGATASGYLERVQVERVFDNEVKIVADTNLKGLEGGDAALKDGDIVKVFPISPTIVNAMTLKGNVTRPGVYQWREGIRVSDVIKDPTEDLLPETHFGHALIERYVMPDFHRELISLNLGSAIFGKNDSENKILEPYDVITVYSKWDFEDRAKAMITGAVNRPGEYEIKEGMRASDLVKLAGGLKKFALPEGGELTRIRAKPTGATTETIPLDIGKALSGIGDDPTLEDNDYLFVRTVPDWRLHQTATITGEVKYPGTYAINKGEKLSSLIERAGGFTARAYLSGAEFARESVRKFQQERIDEMVDRLEKELLSAQTAQTATASNTDEAKLMQLEAEQKRSLIAKLRTARAKGRVAMQIERTEDFKGTVFDIELEDADTLRVPADPRTVQVVGSVYSQNAFVFETGRGYKHYVERAGGYTRHADSSGIYVLKANGMAFRAGDTDLGSGDTVIVPEKLERIAWMRNVKDMTQILFQIAVTAGVLIVAF